jgi:glutathione synthase/RimK-type ligase-like ATP-grasp enzyme
VIALVTATAARHLDEDLPPLVAALDALGRSVSVVVWDDPSVDWSTFDAAVVRSTWDYVPRRDEFLAWATAVADRTLLLNPPAVLTWSSDKHYLADLARAGVPITPTTFVEPGSDLDEGAWPAGEVVVKPAVSAGSADTARHGSDPAGRRDARDHVAALVAAGRCALVQPYLADVDRDGETALVYLDGVFSHAIRKGPILSGTTAFVEGLYAAEDITARTPSSQELALGDRVLGLVPGGAPLYVRVDVVPGADGPVVLEVEACEPSLFFAHGPGSAERFATALLGRLGRNGAAPGA